MKIFTARMWGGISLLIGVIICSSGISFAGLGSLQDPLEQRRLGTSEGSVNQSMVPSDPISSGTNSGIAVSPAEQRSSQLGVTISGMRQAGMDLGDMVGLLLQDGKKYSVSEISTGLLKNGNYGVGEIRAALISAGVSDAAADSSLPRVGNSLNSVAPQVGRSSGNDSGIQTIQVVNRSNADLAQMPSTSNGTKLNQIVAGSTGGGQVGQLPASGKGTQLAQLDSNPAIGLNPVFSPGKYIIRLDEGLSKAQVQEIKAQLQKLGIEVTAEFELSPTLAVTLSDAVSLSMVTDIEGVQTIEEDTAIGLNPVFSPGQYIIRLDEGLSKAQVQEIKAQLQKLGIEVKSELSSSPALVVTLSDAVSLSMITDIEGVQTIKADQALAPLDRPSGTAPAGTVTFNNGQSLAVADAVGEGADANLSDAAVDNSFNNGQALAPLDRPSGTAPAGTVEFNSGQALAVADAVGEGADANLSDAAVDNSLSDAEIALVENTFGATPASRTVETMMSEGNVTVVATQYFDVDGNLIGTRRDTTTIAEASNEATTTTVWLDAQDNALEQSEAPDLETDPVGHWQYQFEHAATPEEKAAAAKELANAVTNLLRDGGDIGQEELAQIVTMLADYLTSDEFDINQAGSWSVFAAFRSLAVEVMFDPANNEVAATGSSSQTLLGTIVGVYTNLLDQATESGSLDWVSGLINTLTYDARVSWMSNQDFSSGLLEGLTAWVGENSETISLMVGVVDDFTAGETGTYSGTQVGGVTTALLNLAYHVKAALGDDQFSSIITSAANLMESDKFADLGNSRGGVFYMAAGVVRNSVLTDADSADALSDVLAGNSEAGTENIRFAAAFINAAKDVIAAGITGETEGDLFSQVNAAVATVTSVMARMEQLGANLTAETLAEYVFSGIDADTIQAYIDKATALVNDDSVDANSRTHIAGVLTQLVKFSTLGNGAVDVAPGSDNFNNILQSAQNLLLDTTAMRQVRDLPQVAHLVTALSDLLQFIAKDGTLSVDQKKEYAGQIGEMLNSAMNFWQESGANPESYQQLDEHIGSAVDTLLTNLTDQGFGQLATLVQEKIDAGPGDTGPGATVQVTATYDATAKTFTYVDADGNEVTVNLENVSGLTAEWLSAMGFADGGQVELTMSEADNTVLLVTMMGEENNKVWEYDAGSHLMAHYNTDGPAVGKIDYVTSDSERSYTWRSEGTDPGKGADGHVKVQQFVYDEAGELSQVQFFTWTAGDRNKNEDQRRYSRYVYRVDNYEEGAVVSRQYFDDPRPTFWEPTMTGTVVKDNQGNIYLQVEGEDGETTTYLLTARMDGFDVDNDGVSGAAEMSQVDWDSLVGQEITVRGHHVEEDNEAGIYYQGEQAEMFEVVDVIEQGESISAGWSEVADVITETMDNMFIVLSSMGLGESTDTEKIYSAIYDQLKTELKAKGIDESVIAKFGDKVMMDKFGVQRENSVDFGDFSINFLTTQMWSAFNANNFTAVQAYANKIVELFSADADTQQAALTEFPSGDDNINAQDALNAVGLAHYLLGKAEESTGNTDQAKVHYQTVIDNYGFAQAYDASTQSFWKVAEAAQTRIDGLNAAEQGIDYGDYSAAHLETKLWEAFNSQNYDHVQQYADKIIELYSGDAASQQAGLTEFPPAAQAADPWALNLVAVAHLLKGDAQAAQGNTTQARQEYNTVLSSYGFAQAYDPAQDLWWKVADAAQDRLAGL